MSNIINFSGWFCIPMFNYYPRGEYFSANERYFISSKPYMILSHKQNNTCLTQRIILSHPTIITFPLEMAIAQYQFNHDRQKHMFVLTNRTEILKGKKVAVLGAMEYLGYRSVVQTIIELHSGTIIKNYKTYQIEDADLIIAGASISTNSIDYKRALKAKIEIIKEADLYKLLPIYKSWTTN